LRLGNCRGGQGLGGTLVASEGRALASAHGFGCWASGFGSSRVLGISPKSERRKPKGLRQFSPYILIISLLKGCLRHAVRIYFLIRNNGLRKIAQVVALDKILAGGKKGQFEGRFRSEAGVELCPSRSESRSISTSKATDRSVRPTRFISVDQGRGAMPMPGRVLFRHRATCRKRN
jgi:hypothetical protein